MLPMRMFLFAILFVQVAQAGMPTSACLHEAMGTAAPHAAVDRAQKGQGAADREGQPAHHLCCCDFNGHCASGVVDAQPTLGGPPAYAPTFVAGVVVDTLLPGFGNPPYHPPPAISV